jgi:thymidylate synthase (FAD)
MTETRRVYMPDGIGYVELDAYTDLDKDIPRIARISTGSENKGARADRKLLATLIREDHGSPLEMGLIRFRVEMPLFLAVQLLRHRMASYSQKSGRYVAFEVQCFSPGATEWRRQGKGNRQMSGDGFDALTAGILEEKYQDSVKLAIKTYQDMLEVGVAREQARMVLPQSVYTSIFAQFNMRSLMNLLRLRLAPDAQPEFREYAKVMLGFVEQVCPTMHRLITIAHEVEKRLKPQYRALWDELMTEWDLEGE